MAQLKRLTRRQKVLLSDLAKNKAAHKVAAQSDVLALINHGKVKYDTKTGKLTVVTV